jgi:hypothetical protein
MFKLNQMITLRYPEKDKYDMGTNALMALPLGHLKFGSNYKYLGLSPLGKGLIMIIANTWNAWHISPECFTESSKKNKKNLPAWF